MAKVDLTYDELTRIIAECKNWHSYGYLAEKLKAFVQEAKEVSDLNDANRSVVSWHDQLAINEQKLAAALRNRDQTILGLENAKKTVVAAQAVIDARNPPADHDGDGGFGP